MESSWNKIVEYVSSHKNSSEKEIQKLWENIFSEIFGYSFLRNEIDSFRSITIGSKERVITDIIIKENNIDLFVVELKCCNSLKDGKKQLISYLKLLNNEIGVLIRDKIYLYLYDHKKSDDEQTNISVEITKNNPNGEKFVELFSKENFDKEKIKEFILLKSKFSNNVKEIKELINSKFVYDVLFDYFSSNDYKNEEIKEALKNFDFCSENKNCKIMNKSHEIRESKIQSKTIKNATNKNLSQEIVTNDIIENIPISEEDKFIKKIKDLYPKLSNGYVIAYKEIFSNTENINYDKLYELLINEYTANRAPAPAWFAKTISKKRKNEEFYKEIDDIYDKILDFVKTYQEDANNLTKNIKKTPISLVKRYCLVNGLCYEHNFKKLIEKLTTNYVKIYNNEYILFKNQMYVWCEYNYNYKKSQDKNSIEFVK